MAVAVRSKNHRLPVERPLRRSQNSRRLRGDPRHVSPINRDRHDLFRESRVPAAHEQDPLAVGRKRRPPVFRQWRGLGQAVCARIRRIQQNDARTPGKRQRPAVGGPRHFAASRCDAASIQPFLGADLPSTVRRVRQQHRINLEFIFREAREGKRLSIRRPCRAAVPGILCDLHHLVATDRFEKYSTFLWLCPLHTKSNVVSVRRKGWFAGLRAHGRQRANMLSICVSVPSPGDRRYLVEEPDCSMKEHEGGDGDGGRKIPAPPALRGRLYSLFLNTRECRYLEARWLFHPN